MLTAAHCPELALIEILLGHVIEGGVLSRVITTSSCEFGQVPFKSVQRNVLGPTPKPVTVVLGLLTLVIVPEPLINVHVPFPVEGVFPASVAVVPQITWLGPAFAVVGWCTAIVTGRQVVVLHCPSYRT